MSAFLCSDRHLSALVNAAVGARVKYPAETPRDLFNLLLAENRASIADRYGERGLREMDPGAHRYTPGPMLSPIEVIKLTQSYQYQSCEHGGWDESVARKWTDALIHCLTCILPGYDKAPWSI